MRMTACMKFEDAITKNSAVLNLSTIFVNIINAYPIIEISFVPGLNWGKQIKAYPSYGKFTHKFTFEFSLGVRTFRMWKLISCAKITASFTYVSSYTIYGNRRFILCEISFHKQKTISYAGNRISSHAWKGIFLTYTIDFIHDLASIANCVIIESCGSFIIHFVVEILFARL